MLGRMSRCRLCQVNILTLIPHSGSALGGKHMSALTCCRILNSVFHFYILLSQSVYLPQCESVSVCVCEIERERQRAWMGDYCDYECYGEKMNHVKTPSACLFWQDL